MKQDIFIVRCHERGDSVMFLSPEQICSATRTEALAQEKACNLASLLLQSDTYLHQYIKTFEKLKLSDKKKALKFFNDENQLFHISYFPSTLES